LLRVIGIFLRHTHVVNKDGEGLAALGLHGFSDVLLEHFHDVVLQVHRLGGGTEVHGQHGNLLTVQSLELVLNYDRLGHAGLSDENERQAALKEFRCQVRVLAGVFGWHHDFGEFPVVRRAVGLLERSPALEFAVLVAVVNEKVLLGFSDCGDRNFFVLQQLFEFFIELLFLRYFQTSPHAPHDGEHKDSVEQFLLHGLHEFGFFNHDVHDHADLFDQVEFGARLHFLQGTFLLLVI